MTMPPIPLTPDDEPQEEITLAEKTTETPEPYGITAALFGFAVVLLLGIFFALSPATVVGLGITDAVFAYLAFLALRPRLPLPTVSATAGALGMLANTSMLDLYTMFHNGVGGVLRMLARLVLAGVLGIILARTLRVDRYPTLVIAISFLVTFLISGLIFIYPDALKL